MRITPVVECSVITNEQQQATANSYKTEDNSYSSFDHTKLDTGLVNMKELWLSETDLYSIIFELYTNTGCFKALV
jgi:hypothetical protein